MQNNTNVNIIIGINTVDKNVVDRYPLSNNKPAIDPFGTPYLSQT